MPSLTGLILSAGRSSRTTIHKALIKIEEKTLLERQVINLRMAGIDKVAIVVGYNSEKIISKHSNLKIEWIQNKNWENGNFSSILKGLEKIRENILLIPVDVQTVNTETIQKIIEIGQKENKTIIPTYNNKGGHPVYLRSKLVEEIVKEKHKIGRLDHILHNESELIRLPVETNTILNNLNSDEEIELFKKSFNQNPN